MNWQRLSARTLDAAMCAMMLSLQRRHRLRADSREVLAAYIESCQPLSREVYFQHSPAEIHSTDGIGPHSLAWTSPLPSGYAENDIAYVEHFPAPGKRGAPTVIFLHALMSASDRGYRRWAARFNAAGWGACFVHLPYHYSRTPRGFRNGELAITADLVRTAEGLRQSVVELRQLMGWLKKRGVREFGLWACSYGGWIGALLASVERDFRFVALIEPIVNVDHAIWQSPTGAALRRELRRLEIEPELPARHFPLTSRRAALRGGAGAAGGGRIRHDCPGGGCRGTAGALAGCVHAHRAAGPLWLPADAGGVGLDGGPGVAAGLSDRRGREVHETHNGLIPQSPRGSESLHLSSHFIPREAPTGGEADPVV